MERTFLLTWNPRDWPWRDFDDDLRRLRLGTVLRTHWSCSVRRDLPVGSWVFLMKLSALPDREKGLIASGITTSGPSERRHWAEGRENETAIYVGVEFESAPAETLAWAADLGSQALERLTGSCPRLSNETKDVFHHALLSSGHCISFSMAAN
jgi:hypothetical protein